MIDRVVGADVAAAQHISQQQAQQSGQAKHAERDAALRPDAAQGSESSQAADSVRTPASNEADRVASIAALRDEALALTRTATEAQLASQAAGRSTSSEPAEPNAPTGEAREPSTRAPEVEGAGTGEFEARQAAADALARQIRDGSAGTLHGNEGRSDIGALRELLGD